MDFGFEINKLISEGYSEDNARARLCQDIVLQGICKGSLGKNITIKGGVAIRNISKDMRRATQDIDIDLIRFSLDEYAIETLVLKLNCINGVTIKKIGKIIELKHQEYRGKRITLQFIDEYGYEMHCSIDVGVHSDLHIEQLEYCFDISYDEKGVMLLMNSYEQMVVEKLKSLLKFRTISTRYKDIFDIHFLLKLVDDVKMFDMIDKYIFRDVKLLENNMDDIINSLKLIFNNSDFIKKIKDSGKNWTGIDENIIFDDIINKMIEIHKIR